MLFRILKNTLNTVLLIIDYPFVFYYTIQKKSKYRLSHKGNLFALILYFLVFATIILDYTKIDFGISSIIFVLYIIFRFIYRNNINNILIKYNLFNKNVLYLLKIYSTIILLIPLYSIYKKGYFII